MKRSILFVAAASLALFLAPAVHSQTAQLMQGTQVRLVLLNGLSTSVARTGDPFTAIVAEPVYLGNQLILPAGAKIHGTVTGIERPKRFSMFRGGASMNLNFQSIEVQSRIFPVRMSLLQLYKSSTEGGKARKDVKEVEGVAVEQKHDIKGDLIDVGIGTGGGTLAGAVFSHVARGFGIGIIGGAAYVMVKKGKDVVLPAETVMLVRLDNTVWVPVPSSTGYSGGMK
ncbi:MAG TPA: hypothetical protein VGT03_13055 [Candidatus Acidoferrales bacterium]|nr:hypothetical protein [Candidatus Acidoferrales bacterium]